MGVSSRASSAFLATAYMLSEPSGTLTIGDSPLAPKFELLPSILFKASLAREEISFLSEAGIFATFLRALLAKSVISSVLAAPAGAAGA